MSVYFITGSRDKFTELQSILGDLEQLEIDLPEIQEIDAHEIIKVKLANARQHHEGSFIVEDTSLYLDALNGLPGPLIKWFMKTVGNEGLFRIACAFENHKAEAKTIIGYANDAEEPQYFEGSFRGTIVEPRGANGFGWDPIFKPEGSDKTFAEMIPEEKNSFSMRRIAAEKLRVVVT
jgi:inosine triphosphate pyrophosphatase